MTVSINGVKYDKMLDAVFAAENGQTIVLDESMTEDVEIYGNKKLTLDLNGQKLTNKAGPTIRVMKHSALDVIDSKSVGEHAPNDGEINSKVVNQPAIQVDTGALFTMNAGKLTRTGEGLVMNNFGTASLSGKVDVASESATNAAIKTGFDLTKDKERPILDAEDSEYEASLTVSGGKIAGMAAGAILNDERSKLVVVGGTLTATQNVIHNFGECDIRGGTITSSEKSVTESGRPVHKVVKKATVFVENKNGKDTIQKESGAVKGDYVFKDTEVVVSDINAGSVTVSGGKLNAAVGQAIFAIIEIPETVVKPVDPVVTGGTFSSVDHTYLPTKYIAAGYAVEGMSVVSIKWDVTDAGVSGVGFTGHRKLIISKAKLTYTDGIVVPVAINDAILVAVNVKGGAIGYYDKADGKIILYSAAGTPLTNPTVLEDLTLVFLEL